MISNFVATNQAETLQQVYLLFAPIAQALDVSSFRVPINIQSMGSCPVQIRTTFLLESCQTGQ